MLEDTTTLPTSILSELLTPEAGDGPRRQPTRRTPRAAQLERSVHAFYRALEEPERLEQALVGTARAFGGELAHLIAADAGGRVRASRLFGNVPPNMEEVDAHYRAINPRIRAGWRLRRGELAYDAAHSTLEQIASDPVYQELFRAYNADWYVGTALIKDERGTVLFGIFRAAAEGHFSKDEMRAFERVARHAASAVDLMMTIDAERTRGAVASVEAFGSSCAVIDASGRVTEASPRFLELSKRLSLFKLEPDGTFVCADGRVNLRLGALLRTVAAGPRATRGDAAPLVLTIRAPNGTLWRVRATPLPERLPWKRGAGRCLLALDELSCTAPLAGRADVLIETFALTPAEASVAIDLAEGAGLRDVAARRAVSYHTVRHQAKSIFSKTGCRTQAELARLLARLLT